MTPCVVSIQASLLSILLLAGAHAAPAPDPRLLETARRSVWINEFEVLAALPGGMDSGAHRIRDFRLADPYRRQLPSEPRSGVCGVRFEDSERRSYRLQTLESAEAATAQGYSITHHEPCGSCSSLSDLAIYMTRDLTEPAKKCTRRLAPSRIRSCYVTRLGFSEACAEAWTYNSIHTRQQCLLVCIKDRIAGRGNNTGDGLSPCIECDELHSGPGFKAMAGRTRRNSGLRSEIEREAGEIRAVDHSAYLE